MPRKKGTVTKSFSFDGKRYYVTGKNEKEAIINMANKLRDLEEGRVIISNTTKVSDWAYRAVDTYKTSQAEITKSTFIRAMKHCVLEHIGNMQLKQVKPLHCQQIINMQAGNSKAYINQVYQILNFIFRTAVENGLIPKNPAEKITRPYGTKTYRRAITEKERHHLIKVCEADDRFILFLLMLYCGCRPSEAREVKGSDIKLMEGQPVLHIRGTKTVNADRLVPIPDVLYQRIQGAPKFDYLCTTGAGRKYNQNSYRRLCERLYRELNISMGCKLYRNQLVPPYPLADDFVPYDLRHTYCTDLQKKGVDIRTAQYLMGHSDISLTANIYTHADNSTILEAAKIINGTTGTTVGTTPNSTKTHQNMI